MAQQARAVHTRQQILNAAAQVFAKRGYAAATMAEILTVAGLTKGAVYFHFASKEELALAVTEAQSPWLEELDLGGPSFQSVIDLTVAYARALQNDPIIRATVRLVIEHGAFDKPQIEAWEVNINLVRDLLLAAQDDLLPSVDINAAAPTITSSFTGIQLTSQVMSGRADLLERVADWWSMLVPGLVKPEVIPGLEYGGSAKTTAHLTPERIARASVRRRA
ncbi:ScbR family autoregulator-binding transcription factor [Kitasatospora sp. CMC57]|uniref:ScbR family autoregulator-binding transcription factor n=1 Tax=Kitasatospora sp. CMC57 TaxID=3231513 RepID=A0AB33K0G8_9ACTN